MEPTSKRARVAPRALSAILAPFQAFFRLQAAGGLVLIGCAALALVWANSPLRWLHTDLFRPPVVHVINDGLMTLFFIIAGVEIKRELVSGELASTRRAAMPLIAAAGGMVLPALIYAALNSGGPGRSGWAVPVATDIAFALGCLSLVRGRVPASLFVFLTALAIFDDLGAIAVIALFYGGFVDLTSLGVALGLSAVLFLLGRSGRRWLWLFAIVSVAVWVMVFQSGVHATIAGVIIGLALPTAARPRALDRAIHLLHGVVVFGIVPLFALANAGVALSGEVALGGSITVGVLLGLVVGKPVGVLTAIAIARALRIASLPTGTTATQIAGTALLAGIGFTMSLLIADLGLGANPLLEDEAKLGVLAGSLVSAVLGLSLIRFTSARRAADPS